MQVITLLNPLILYLITILPGENLGEAKRLTLVIEELSKAGQVLWRYELQKRDAIVREDYDTARAKTVNINTMYMLRQFKYGQPRFQQLHSCLLQRDTFFLSLQ